MKKLILYLCFACFFACSPSTPKTSQDMNDSKQVDYALVIHGGAGTILKENMTAELESAYKKMLNLALDTGHEILKNGGSSLDAVCATIQIMEDSPLFNAGKGAVFTHQGNNELDASIMEGKSLNAGAVGGITTVKNPILAARAVMEHSDHVFMVGSGAEEFCLQKGIEQVNPEYYKTDRRWNSLQRILKKEKKEGLNQTELSESKHGTVGAVALDQHGNIVAGTSTGGMTNKKFNRIGDSPVIGAGTYANNNTCGVSCTGHGEYFIRYSVAHAVSAAMEYGKLSLEEATDDIIMKKLVEAKGTGGLIALDKKGNISMPFNTAGMYRAYITDKKRYIGIYKHD